MIRVLLALYYSGSFEAKRNGSGFWNLLITKVLRSGLHMQPKELVWRGQGAEVLEWTEPLQTGNGTCVGQCTSTQAKI